MIVARAAGVREGAMRVESLGRGRGEGLGEEVGPLAGDGMGR